MAERRMFAKSIIDSDAFLTMPLSAQCLYFHLAMRADDEGFVSNLKSIMMLVGAKEDDAKILLAKNFVLAFDSGVIVIKHWRIHNWIRGDRIKPTNYTEEKAMLSIKENGSYTMEQTDCQTFGRHLADSCQSNVSQDAAQNSIGKDSIDEDSIYTVQTEPEEIDIRPINQPKKVLSSEQTKRFEAFWKAYPKKQSKATAEKAWSKILPDDFEMNVILNAIEQAKQKDSRFRDMQFIPLPATWLNARSWENEYEDQEPQPQAMARPQRSGMGSFDADEFFNAAVNRRRKG